MAAETLTVVGIGLVRYLLDKLFFSSGPQINNDREKRLQRLRERVHRLEALSDLRMPAQKEDIIALEEAEAEIKAHFEKVEVLKEREVTRKQVGREERRRALIRRIQGEKY